MSDDHMQMDTLADSPPPGSLPQPSLPEWLALRFLRKDEKIALVRGPRFNPTWERFVTHPALFLVALAFSAAGCWAAWLIVGSWSGVLAPVFLAAGGIVLTSILTLGIFAAYFTRLVVTDSRIFILQGYEMCRSWSMDKLPPSLIRYGPRGREEAGLSIDLDTVRQMFGGTSEHFADAKAILAFGKQLDQIKVRDDARS